MGKMLNRFARFLLKALCLIPLFLFGAWLIQMVYFPGLGERRDAMAAKGPEASGIFGTIMRQTDPVPRGHFHQVDEYVLRSEPNPQLCLSCHGTYPHSKGEKVRSLLNFHSGYIACSVCHSQKDSVQGGLKFAWVDRNSGNIVDRVEGEYGKYPATISPITMGGAGLNQVFMPVSHEAAAQFLKLKDQFTPDQMAQAKLKLHEHISNQPVLCAECHRKDGYLSFAALGFSSQRINHLNSTEVVGLIENYGKFYLPSQIDFGGGGTGR